MMVSILGIIARVSFRRSPSPWISHSCRRGLFLGRVGSNNYCSSLFRPGVNPCSLMDRCSKEEEGLHAEAHKHGFVFHDSQGELHILNDNFYLNTYENDIIRVWGTNRMDPDLKSYTRLFDLLDSDKSRRRSDLHTAFLDLSRDFLVKVGCQDSHIYFLSREDIERNFRGDFQNFGRSLYSVICFYGSHTAHPCSTAYADDDDPDHNVVPFCYAVFSSFSRVKAGVARTYDSFRDEDVEKVEFFQFVDDFHHRRLHAILAACEEFYKMLEIPFRVLESRYGPGPLGDPREKYVIEGWFPASQTYEELASCSVYIRGIQHEMEYAEMCSETWNIHCKLAVMDRTMGCMLENHQRDDGIDVPPHLRPYMDGESFLPLMT